MKKLFLLLALLPALLCGQSAPAIGGFITASTTTGSAAPSGAAGGVLSGTYPNPGFASIAAYSLLTNNTSGSAAPGASTSFILGAATPSVTSNGGVILSSVAMTSAQQGNNYAEFAIQGQNAGAAASTDYIAYADNATSTTHFVDVGINSSGYAAGGSAIFPFVANAAYLFSGSDDLYVGTLASNTLHLYTNSVDRMTISGAGTVSANGLTSFAGSPLTFATADTNQNIILAPNGTGQLVVAGGVALPTPQAGFTYQFGAFGTIDAVATSPTLQFRRTNTSAASPSNVLSGNTLMSLGAKGYAGAAYSGNTGALVFSATQDFTGSNNGTQFAVQVTPNNSTSVATKLLVAQSGNTLFGGLTTDGTGQLQVSGTGILNFGATALAQINVSADTTAGVLTFASPSAGSFAFKNGTVTVNGVAYTFGSLPSGATTSGPVMTIPATTYTVTGTNTATAFQAIYHGVPTFTDASVGTVTDLFSEVWAGPAAVAGSLVGTRKHSLGVLDATAATSPIIGAVVISTTFGTSATSVAFGGGSIYAGGSILSVGATSGIGYATGAGGAVTQATNRTTAVTLNNVTGAITTNTTSLAALALATFTVNDTAVAIGDHVALTVRSGQTNVGTLIYVTAVAAGSFNITVDNTNGVTAETGAIIINFAVIKAVSA